MSSYAHYAILVKSVAYTNAHVAIKRADNYGVKFRKENITHLKKYNHAYRRIFHLLNTFKAFLPFVCNIIHFIYSYEAICIF